MDSETNRIKNNPESPEQNIDQAAVTIQQNKSNFQKQPQPLKLYQNIQIPQQPGVQQNPQPYIINQPIMYQQFYGQPVFIY